MACHEAAAPAATTSLSGAIIPVSPETRKRAGSCGGSSMDGRSTASTAVARDDEPADQDGFPLQPVVVSLHPNAVVASYQPVVQVTPPHLQQQQQPPVAASAAAAAAHSIPPHPAASEAPPRPQVVQSYHPPLAATASKRGSIFHKGHNRTESVLSKISRLSIRSLGKHEDGESDATETEDDEQAVADLGNAFGTPKSSSLPSHGAANKKESSAWILKNHRVFQNRFSFNKIWKKQKEGVWTHLKRKIGTRWRFDSDFEWRSPTKFEGRLVPINPDVLTVPPASLLDPTDTANLQINFPKRSSSRFGRFFRKPNEFRSSKYNPLTFIPVNFMEQFRRMANIYFAFTLIIAFAMPDSPVDPKSWILSFGFVVVVTMMKQGYEDYLRHVNDRKTNSRKVRRIHQGKVTECQSAQIEVGDLIVLENDEVVPCDAVILSTSHEYGRCYTMTANLDGETSLKTKVAAKLTKRYKTVPELSSLAAAVECENPNPKLDSFLGRMFLFAPPTAIPGSGTQGDSLRSNSSVGSSSKRPSELETCSLSLENLVHAGTQVKNTDQAVAVCVYGGRDTKMALNSMITINKFSTMERILNRYILFLVFVLVSEMTLFTILSICLGAEYVTSLSGTSFLAQMVAQVGLGPDPAAVLKVGPSSSSSSSSSSSGSSLQPLLFPLSNDLSGGAGGILPKVEDAPDEDVMNKEEDLLAVNDRSWYLGSLTERTVREWILMFLYWNIIFNYIIPISLYVALEVQKFCSSMFFSSDLGLYDEERDISAACRTSDINEELGLVTHLFVDKTGTLTRNEMVFQKLCFEGRLYDRVGALPSYDLFLMALVLCHSVEVTNGKFMASSPEEKAILEEAKASGYEFLGSHPNGDVEVKVKGETVIYTQLAELTFDSYRKCMSVIIREKKLDPKGDQVIHVFVKGAESSVLPACANRSSQRGQSQGQQQHDQGQQQAAEEQQQQQEQQQPQQDFMEITRVLVDEFASEGHRTLVYGYKRVSRSAFETFAADLEEAKQSIVNRIKYVRQVYRTMETDLQLLGAVAIEDRLQDGVQETIQKLGQAGITTWMVTGDKKETAVNLGHSSGMLCSPAKIVDLCQVKDHRSLVLLIKQLHREYRASVHSRSTSLIIDGKAVAAIMRSDSLKNRLSYVADRVQTVIACRLSPVQKCQLVRLMKRGDNLTAALGDGGNDIAMIQEAHVGLGIIGFEGTAASEASDFAFTKFSHLQRVLLVHGHWYYVRIAFLIQYSFYKQVACFASHALYAFYSNYSANTMFDSMFLFMYNTVYAAVPVVIYGLSEQTFPEGVLLANPGLYKINRNSKRASASFLPLMLLGLWHALVAFFSLLLIAYGSNKAICGSSMDIRYFGSILGMATVLVVNLKVLVESRYWSWPLLLSVGLSVVCYLPFTLLFQQWYETGFPVVNCSFDVFRTYVKTFETDCALTTLLYTALVTVASLAPDLVLATLKWTKFNHVASAAKSGSSSSCWTGCGLGCLWPSRKSSQVSSAAKNVEAGGFGVINQSYLPSDNNSVSSTFHDAAVHI